MPSSPKPSGNEVLRQVAPQKPPAPLEGPTRHHRGRLRGHVGARAGPNERPANRLRCRWA